MRPYRSSVALRRVGLEVHVGAVEQFVRACRCLAPEALDGLARIHGLRCVDPDHADRDAFRRVHLQRVAVDDVDDRIGAVRRRRQLADDDPFRIAIVARITARARDDEQA